MFELLLDYQACSKLDNDTLLKLLQSMYPDRDFYQMSTAWRDSYHYILKCKGTKGDLIAGWTCNPQHVKAMYESIRRIEGRIV